MKTKIKYVSLVAFTLLAATYVNGAEEVGVNIYPDSKKLIILESNNIQNFNDLKSQRETYIQKTYPGYTPKLTMHTKDEQGRYVLVCFLENSQGKTITASFDVTDAYAMLKNKGGAIKDQIEELEKKH